MRTLICGNGEVGKSLQKVLQSHYDVSIKDMQPLNIKEVEILHICFPFSDKFIIQVKEYQKEYNPKFTIIHSTVPVGTNRKLKSISSPCLGIHPHLEQSFKIFTKFLGGDQVSEVADYFRRTGMKVYLCDEPETIELMKILDTTFYGVCVEYTKDVKRQCKKFNVPFEAWTLWTENYNSGYQKLDYPEYVRPNLIPIEKKIGGHCVRENCELLETEFTKLIKKLNEKIKLSK